MKKSSMVGKVIIALVMVTAIAAILVVSWNKGQSRHVYDIQRFDKYIPVPMIFDSYQGTGILEGDKIRVSWSFQRKPEQPSTPYFTCLGWFAYQPQDIYILELDGHIYLEKSENVAPLIQALAELSTGVPEGTFKGKDLDFIVGQIPTDRQTLDTFVRRFRQVEVSR